MGCVGVGSGVRAQLKKKKKTTTENFLDLDMIGNCGKILKHLKLLKDLSR
jgi:hypothetical protein